MWVLRLLFCVSVLVCSVGAAAQEPIRTAEPSIEERAYLVEDLRPFDWSMSQLQTVRTQHVPERFYPTADPAFLRSSVTSINVRLVQVTTAEVSAQELAYQAADILSNRGEASVALTYVWDQDAVGVAANAETVWLIPDVQDSLDRALSVAEGPGHYRPRVRRAGQVLHDELGPAVLAEAKTHLDLPDLQVTADRYAYAHPHRELPIIEAWAKSRPRKVRVLVIDALHDGSIVATPDRGGWTLYMADSVEQLRGASRLQDPFASNDRVVVVWRTSPTHQAQLWIPARTMGEGYSWANTGLPYQRRWHNSGGATDLSDEGQAHALSRALNPILGGAPHGVLERQFWFGREFMPVALTGVVMLGGGLAGAPLWTRRQTRRGRSRVVRFAIEAWRRELACRRLRLSECGVDRGALAARAKVRSDGSTRALLGHLERLDYLLDAVDFRLAMVERKRTPGVDAKTLVELLDLLDKPSLGDLLAIADEHLAAVVETWSRCA